MSTSLSTKALPPNKNDALYSCISDIVLIRTGVIDDELSFYHAILYGYSKEYIDMTNELRVKLANRLKDSVINKDEWEKGIAAKLSFIHYFKIVLNEKYTNENENENEKNKELNSLFELFPQTYFDKLFINAKYSQDGIINLSKNILINVEEKISEKNSSKYKKVKEQYLDLLTNVLKEVINKSLEEYNASNKKEEVNNNITSDICSEISDKINRDIYFLDEQGVPIQTGIMDKNNLKKRKSIILIKLSNNRFQIAGNIISQDIFQRQFFHEEPIIQGLYTLITNPMLIPTKFPTLIRCLSTDLKRKVIAGSPTKKFLLDDKNNSKKTHETINLRKVEKNN